MRKGALALLLAAASLTGLAGCGEPQAEMKTDPKTVMNPTGDPSKLPPQAQGMGAQQQAAGQAASKNMDEMARQMREAQARSGGR